MTPEEESDEIFRKLFDRNEIFEIDPDLLRVMTPAEIAEADQILAMRFAIADAAMGLGKQSFTAQTIKHCVGRLNWILKEVHKRLNSDQ